MAYQIPGFLFPMVSGADLTAGGSTPGQFRPVTVDATDGKVILVTAVDVQPIGILQNGPRDGEEATIMHSGISKVHIGTGGVTAGDLLALEAAAGGVLITATATDIVVGMAIEDCAATGIGSALLLLGSAGLAP